ncbi:MAG: antitoxin YefM [Cellvibrionaceae bacterium]|jgi:antitoxin YefM
MLNTSVNQFRNNLKRFIEQVIHNHQPLRVTRRNGDDFVVISADDWDRHQETVYILQNQSLMQQIAESMETHKLKRGYNPTPQELDEIISL